MSVGRLVLLILMSGCGGGSALLGGLALIVIAIIKSFASEPGRRGDPRATM